MSNKAPTIKSFSDARDYAARIRQAALTACSGAVSWSEADCEAALVAGQGWPEYPEPPVLKNIIDLIDADAQAKDAEATLRAFQDRPETP